jgi:hypothetical protein
LIGYDVSLLLRLSKSHRFFEIRVVLSHTIKITVMQRCADNQAPGAGSLNP